VLDHEFAFFLANEGLSPAGYNAKAQRRQKQKGRLASLKPSLNVSALRAFLCAFVLFVANFRGLGPILHPGLRVFL
jgi:hypothetical protein